MFQENINKHELSKRVSISTQYLGRLISGKQTLANATVRVLIEMSLALNVSTDFLLALDELDEAPALRRVALGSRRAWLLELENFDG